MTTNPTPKSRFLDDAQNITQHNAMLERESFDRAVDTAILDMARTMADHPPADMGGCAAYWLRMQGAFELVTKIKTLAERPQQAPRVVSPNLDHNVK